MRISVVISEKVIPRPRRQSSSCAENLLVKPVTALATLSQAFCLVALMTELTPCSTPSSYCGLDMEHGSRNARKRAESSWKDGVDGEAAAGWRLQDKLRHIMVIRDYWRT